MGYHVFGIRILTLKKQAAQEQKQKKKKNGNFPVKCGAKLPLIPPLLIKGISSTPLTVLQESQTFPIKTPKSLHSRLSSKEKPRIPASL